MTKRKHLLERLSNVNATTFEALALDIFRYQATNNAIYASFLSLLGVEAKSVQAVREIPFLPIELFKSYLLQSGSWHPVRVFTSSGTTGSTTSRHALRAEAQYRSAARRTFELQYGPLPRYTILALLPAYLERSGSSLVFMADDFIRATGDPDSGFFLHDHLALLAAMERARSRDRKILLLGVSFALLDLAEAHPGNYGDVIVMETGGMKGRRKELTREELHAQLQAALQVPVVHSEYGMTELLSQAYSPGRGIFYPAPSMQVLSREITDPLSWTKPGKTGVLSIVDLANLDTVSFVATQDLGRVASDGSFEVLGRLDASDVRGCNLMVW
jgi:hypothetical protein